MVYLENADNANETLEYSYDACYMKQGFCEVLTKPDVELIPTGTPSREGNRRDPASLEKPETIPTNLITTRGYTGHEHMDEFGLINMNGRVYDPNLARFLNPDPDIANPTFT